MRSAARLRRVYLPLAAAGLDALVAGAEVLPFHGRLGYAVTALVRSCFPEQDEEELEYEALCVAAESLLSSEDSDQQHRLQGVIAADLPDGQVQDVLADDATAAPPEIAAQDAYAVRLSSGVRLGQVVSVHVPDRAEDSPGELLWYDVSELPTLAHEVAHP